MMMIMMMITLFSLDGAQHVKISRNLRYRFNSLNSTQQATSKSGSREERSPQKLNHIPDSLDNSQVAF